jgi:hypothetical protein
MNVRVKASYCDRRKAGAGYFSSLITVYSALSTSLSSRTPLFPGVRKSHCHAGGSPFPSIMVIKANLELFSDDPEIGIFTVR